MYALVTGSRGFVGPYLIEHLRQSGSVAIELEEDVNICDRSALVEDVKRYLSGIPAGTIPVVFHLAALSHVGQSWNNLTDVISVNVAGTANICSILHEAEFDGRLIFVSSAEVYGNHPGKESLSEWEKAAPLSPYAASKLAGEEFVLQFHRAWGLDVVVARPFNHIGPGQRESFLVSAIAKRITEAVHTGESFIEVGNLSAVRDFLDVRDVVRAYCDLAEAGESGKTYNISSGFGTIVSQLVGRMIELCGANLDMVVSPALTRNIEVPRLVGNSSELIGATGFDPKFTLDATLLDVLSWWRARLDV